ncbi:hypothetical protein ABMA28_011244 [Loxostege sticticalis]|uniref:BPTI/Kunitz inhibitor domain-containing protein n=1 Tax=Loxostege sticticalis TaxID=481309 RepID=A0ABD0S8V9_LOXSC
MFKLSIFLLVLVAVFYVISAEHFNPVCEQPLKTGPCRASFKSYGYNTTTEKCQQFTYGGCQGNENRFDTLEECQDACEYDC